MEEGNSAQEVNKNICKNCGEELKDGAKFCSKCGTRVNEASDDSMNAKQAKKKQNAFIAIAVILTIIVGVFGIQSVQKKSLEDKLEREEWWTYDDETRLYLNFSNGRIDYDGYFGILGRRDIANLDYEIVSGSKINVEGIEVEVEFGDGTVIFKPSFVNSDSISIWLD